MNSKRFKRSDRRTEACAAVGLILLLAGPTLAVEVLVCDSGTNRVLRYDGVTGAAIDTGEGAGAGVFIGSTVPGGSGALSSPYGILLGTDGNIYVASQANNSIKLYDGTNGHYIRDFVTAGSGTLSSPDGMAWGPDGNLYVSSFGNSKILRYYGPNPPAGHTAGEFKDVFVNAGVGGLNGPRGIMFGPAGTDGNLYVAAYSASKVLCYDAGTGAFVRVAANLGTGYPSRSPWNMIYEQVYHSERDRDWVLADPTAPVFEYNKLWAGNLLMVGAGYIWIIKAEDGGTWGAFYNGDLINPRGVAWGPHRSPINPSDEDDPRQSLYLGNFGNNNIKVVAANEKNCGSLVSTGLNKPTYLLFKCGTKPATLIRQVLGNNGLQGNAAHTVTLQGDNLETLMPAGGGSVTLKKMRNQSPGLVSDGTATIAGANYRMSGNDLLVDFDLTAAEGGRYGIIPNDPCGTAMTFPDAVLVYMPALTNGGFEEGWSDARTNNNICDNISEWDADGGGNKPRPKHWDHEKLGYQQGTGANQYGIYRDGNIWYPSCADGRVIGLTGDHYGSIENNFNDQRAWNGMFQTIAAPNLGPDGATTTADYDIYIDALVASFQGISSGQILLYDGDDMSFQLIAQTTIPNNQPIIVNPDNPPPTALVRSPYYRATVPAGYVYQSNPRILTIAFLSQSEVNDVNPEGTQALKAFHIDNVRNSYGGCRGWPVWADATGDGAVDMDDFGAFQACYTVDNQSPLYYGTCGCFDHNADWVINYYDFTDFQGCAWGPAIPVTDPNCQ